MADDTLANAAGASSSNAQRTHDARTHTLKLDNVVSSQPELGPTPPDGGYGWVVLAVSCFLMVFIPSIQASYGIIVLFTSVEMADKSEFYVWDIEIAFSAIFFVAFWILADPWSETVVQINRWPRFLSLSATSLFCCGIFVLYAAKISDHHIIVYMFAGALSGIGASFSIQQIVSLIHKYFRKRLRLAKFFLHMANMMGFMLMPHLIEHFAMKSGIATSILDYTFMTLAMLLAAILFESPKYISQNASPSLYTLLEGTPEDDDNVFDKNQIVSRPQNDNERPFSATGSPSTENDLSRSDWVTFSDLDDTVTQPQNSTCVDVECHPEPSESSNNNTVMVTKTESTSLTDAKRRIKEAFTDISDDIERVNEHNFAPRPLFDNNQQLRENASFTYDNNQVYNTITETISTTPGRIETSSLKDDLALLLVPTFHKSLLTVLTNKLSLIVFWTFFPTLLYKQVEFLNAQHTVQCIMVVVTLGGILGMMPTFFVIPREKINLGLALVFWMGALGFDIVTLSYSRNWVIFGGVLSVTSILTGTYMCEILVHENSGYKNKFKTLLKTLVGILILVIMIPLNLEYKFCYRAIALLQFIMGSIWISNILFKKIRDRIVR